MEADYLDLARTAARMFRYEDALSIAYLQVVEDCNRGRIPTLSKLIDKIKKARWNDKAVRTSYKVALKTPPQVEFLDNTIGRVDHYDPRNEIRETLEPLQQRVFDLLLEGHTIDAIASMLELSVYEAKEIQTLIELRVKIMLGA